MIHEVMTGICDAVQKEFGERYTIYTETPVQDTKGPAFSITCIRPEMEKQISGRLKLKLLYGVHYFPETADKNRERAEVFERLYGCLELVNAAGKWVRGVPGYKENPDKTLDFTAEYTLFLSRREESELMENYVMKGDVKDGSSKNI